MSNVKILLVIIICLLVVIEYMVWQVTKMVAEIHGAVIIAKWGRKDNE